MDKVLDEQLETKLKCCQTIEDYQELSLLVSDMFKEDTKEHKAFKDISNGLQSYAILNTMLSNFNKHNKRWADERETDGKF